MGDVIMLLPVLKGLLAANKEVEIYLLTRKFLFPFFKDIENLHLIEADLKGKHKGVSGLFSLYKEIKEEVAPDIVIDLHQVLRSYLLNFFFRLSGLPVKSFDKGTKEKKQQVKSKRKKALPSTIDRYELAFENAGFNVERPNTPVLKQELDQALFEKLLDEADPQIKLVGIAPFAQHQQKVWGIDKVEQLISFSNENLKANFILFGGGKTEIDQLNSLAQKFSNVFVAAKHFKLDSEIGLIGELNAMISMDSANMHMAALCGIPTISIWGGTHSSLGFAPYMQPRENIIEYSGDKIACRPCSVYGNKKCIYNDVRCMKYVEVEQVYNQLKAILTKESN